MPPSVLLVSSMEMANSQEGIFQQTLGQLQQQSQSQDGAQVRPEMLDRIIDGGELDSTAKDANCDRYADCPIDPIACASATAASLPASSFTRFVVLLPQDKIAGSLAQLLPLVTPSLDPAGKVQILGCSDSGVAQATVNVLQGAGYREARSSDSEASRLPFSPDHPPQSC